MRKPFREEENFGAIERHLGVKYVYEEGQEPAVGEPEIELRSEQLESLPQELRDQLYHAVLELDTDRTHEVIGLIEKIDPSLGKALGILVRDLNYNRLLRLLEKNEQR